MLERGPRLLNWYLRYEPFLEVLDEHGAGSVLDVGSGWYGLTWYSKRRVVQTDLHFDGSPPAAGRVGTARFVRASADRLPFADATFDWVISSDMMEHLPVAIRSCSVGELVRVARHGVVVGFPEGWSARLVDRVLAGLVRLARRRPPVWLREHLHQAAYPSADDLRRGLPPGWEVAEVRPNGNAFLQLVVVAAEMVPLLGRSVASRDRWAARHGVPRWFHTAPAMRRVYVLRPTTVLSD